MKLKFFAATVLVAGLLLSCQQKASTGSEPTANNASDLGYAFGELIGNNIKSTGVKFDYDAFRDGLRDSVEGKQLKFPLDKANQTVQTALKAKHDEQMTLNKAKGEKYLADNGKKSGVTTTASGLQYEVIKAGTGPKPKETDMVRVNYEGRLIDGTVFDSTAKHNNQPAEFPLNQVIPGWKEGIQLMPVGSKFRLTIPAELGYGDRGSNGIGPDEVLIFDVELLAILPPPPAPKGR